MCTAQDSPKRLPVLARVGMVVLLIAVALVFGGVAFWLTKPSQAADMPPDEVIPMPILGLVFLVLGGMGIAAGVILYAIVLTTDCFIRDLSRPFFNAFKVRVYACQLIVPLPFVIGLGLLVCIPVYPRLVAAGVESSIAMVGSVVGTFAIAQIPLMWIQLWAPLEKSLILRRMRSLGVGPEDLERGRLVGISDPGRSTLKKLSLVEDDLGMLWITPDALIYFGDTQLFEIRPEQLRSIEQKADAGNVSAIAGTAHVILTYLAPDQQEHRVRLHVEGIWTLGRKARAMDELAATLRQWEQGVPSVAVPAPALPQARATVAR